MAPPTTTTPPTITKPPPPGSEEEGDDTPAPQTGISEQWPGLKHIYLSASGPEFSFNRLVNLLLDNRMFVVNAMDAAPGSLENIDLFGLGTQPTEAGEGPVLDYDETMIDSYRMVDLQSEEGREYVAKWIHANTTDDKPWNELTDADKATYDVEVTKTIGTNRYMYVSPTANMDADAGPQDAWYNTPEKTHIGIIPSFDGTPMGEIRTVEEALMGLPLDKASMYHLMTNLARDNPDYFRGVQAQLGMMGYYGDQAGQVRWGIAQDMDRVAMYGFISDLLTEHLGKADQARRTGLPLPSVEMDEFITGKFNDYVGGWVEKMRGGTADDPVPEFITDLTSQIAAAAEEQDIDVDNAKSAEIAQAIQGVLGSGDVNLDKALNIDLLGMAVNDSAIARADTFLFGPSGFYGDPENVKLGVQGSHADLVRLAGLAGVDVQVGRSDLPPGQGVSGLDTEQRKNVARFLFHIIDQNVGQGNMTMTGNYFANTVGFQQFGSQNFDSRWLTKTIVGAQSPELSPTYNVTMEEQTEERLAAMNDIESRVMAAVGTAKEMDRSERTRAAYDVFRYFAPGTRARRSRIAG